MTYVFRCLICARSYELPSRSTDDRCTRLDKFGGTTPCGGRLARDFLAENAVIRKSSLK